MSNQFQRLELMLKDDLIKIQNNHVLVVGIGGVGSFAIECLARCGIKKMTIIDKDVVDITNINRQLIALHSTIGQSKAKVMKERILDINPNCEVIALELFLNKENIVNILNADIDFVIDACDTIETKYLIMEHCLQNNIEFICSMGAANKIESTNIKVIDLSKTYNDPIAKVLRLKVKKHRLKGNIPVAFSDEIPKKPKYHNENDNNVKSRKELPLLSSNSFVPSVFGIVCANYCFKRLMNR